MLSWTNGREVLSNARDYNVDSPRKFESSRSTLSYWSLTFPGFVQLFNMMTAIIMFVSGIYSAMGISNVISFLLISQIILLGAFLFAIDVPETSIYNFFHQNCRFLYTQIGRLSTLAIGFVICLSMGPKGVVCEITICLSMVFNWKLYESNQTAFEQKQEPVVEVIEVSPQAKSTFENYEVEELERNEFTGNEDKPWTTTHEESAVIGPNTNQSAEAV